MRTCVMLDENNNFQTTLTTNSDVWSTTSTNHFPCLVFLEGQYTHLQSISTQFHMSSSTVLYHTANKNNTECIFKHDCHVVLQCTQKYSITEIE
jgi:hypothetical protein